MHKFIYSQKDSWISETTSSQNYGGDEVLELRKDFKSDVTASIVRAVSRILVQFDVTPFSESVMKGDLGSRFNEVSYSLHLYSTEASELPATYSLQAFPLSESWEEGTGKFSSDPTTQDGVTWDRKDQRLDTSGWTLKGGYASSGSRVLGSGSGTTTLPAHKWLKESDVLFAIGSSLTRTSYGQSFPENKVLIQNSENIDDINKDYSIDVGLNGDAKLTLQALIEAVKEEIGSSGREDTNGVINAISALKSEWLAEWAPLLNSNEKPINTYRVIGDLQKTLDKDNSIVTHDAGAPRDTIMPFYTASLPHTYIGWGKTTHLGYGIPLMIGAKKAKPERFCLNFMGDGAFGMSGLDLETSVRSGLPITTVLLNNGGMATYPGGYPASKELSGVTYMSGDYATIAEGLGAVGIRVSEPSGVIPAIEEAKRLNADGKTCLLDIKTNLEGKRSNFM